MVKINQEEYEVLKGLEDKWKWITRDIHSKTTGNIGGIRVFKNKPNYFEHYHFDVEGEIEIDWKYLDGSIFQFIQWEDEEPYNIAELIEEYENKGFLNKNLGIWVGLDNLQHADNDTSKLVSEESEETEMKEDIEWLKEQMNKPIYGGEHFILGYGKAVEKFNGLVDQLDEPEVLSSDWIKDNQLMWTSIYGAEYYVPANKLYGKIVPEQELPVIPQWVADDIESKKRIGILLNAAMSEFPKTKLEKELDIDKHECNEIYARAWLDGFTVEEEQRYYVKDTKGRTLLAKMTYSRKGKRFDKVEPYNDIIAGYKKELTEQEIKDYDERYWSFAVKVEALEK